ncbi:hypothetical protein BC567DRAFT_223272 [Phyllosticta citribraziliensis]
MHPAGRPVTWVVTEEHTHCSERASDRQAQKHTTSAPPHLPIPPPFPPHTPSKHTFQLDSSFAPDFSSAQRLGAFVSGVAFDASCVANTAWHACMHGWVDRCVCEEGIATLTPTRLMRLMLSVLMHRSNIWRACVRACCVSHSCLPALIWKPEAFVDGLAGWLDMPG